jgi:thioredoxin-related protein
MKQLFWLMLLAMPFSTRSQTITEDGGINWITGLTWEQVKDKAKKENKFMFIDAYATWCGPCKEMDKKVYTDKKVGDVVNSQFISVKLQMDETDKDDELVQSWYPVVKDFKQRYSIEGYPTFLFFNGDGKLIHKGLGYKSTSDFIDVAKDALTDPEERYAKSIVKFQKGQLDYQSMPDLAMQALGKKNRQLAIEVARTYKEKYLDTLTDENAFQKGNLKLLGHFCDVLINSKDRYFRLFYTNPDLADSIMAEKISGQVALIIIKKEELYNNIYGKDGMPIKSPKPKWKVYQRSIKNKYGEKYVDVIFPNEQIDFCLRANDWKNYVKYVNEKIKKYPPQMRGQTLGFGRGILADATILNQYAWRLFLFCDNKKHLEKGLAWAELALKSDTVNHAAYYDTKANILYKIGKINEAVEMEELALRLSNNSDKAILEALRKMKTGLPTWPIPDEKKAKN